MKYQRCCICKCIKHPNLKIFGKNICLCCENELIKEKPSDKHYDYYIEKVKALFK